jgi:hypothetical protein
VLNILQNILAWYNDVQRSMVSGFPNLSFTDVTTGNEFVYLLNVFYIWSMILVFNYSNYYHVLYIRVELILGWCPGFRSGWKLVAADISKIVVVLRTSVTNYNAFYFLFLSTLSIFGVLAVLWKATTNFVVSLHPSICSNGLTRLPIDRFSRHFILFNSGQVNLWTFIEVCQENLRLLKMGQKRHFTWIPN